MDRDEGVAPASNDAYTGMLSISLLALLSGCLLLYLDYSQYPDSKPPEVQKLAPGKSLADGNIPKGKDKEFHIEPDNIELPPGGERTVEAKLGKVQSVDIDPPKAGLTSDIVTDTTVRIIAAMDAVPEKSYMVTFKSKDDKSFRLPVTIKKEKDKK